MKILMLWRRLGYDLGLTVPSRWWGLCEEVGRTVCEMIGTRTESCHTTMGVQCGEKKRVQG